MNIPKYRHRQTGQIVEAVTFDELVEIGREQNPGRPGMPWSFEIWGYHVTHETDTRYLVGQVKVTTGGVIAFGQRRILMLFGAGEFPGIFDPVTETPDTSQPAPPPTELDIIEATEKSAQMMLGMAARARGAVWLEEENAKLQRRLDEVITSRADDRITLARLRIDLGKATDTLSKALGAEDYDLNGLVAMAIEKIRDLDRKLTESKGEVKLISHDRGLLQKTVKVLREREAGGADKIALIAELAEAKVATKLATDALSAIHWIAWSNDAVMLESIRLRAKETLDSISAQSP